MKQSVYMHKIFAEYFKGIEALAYALSRTLAEGSICMDIELFKNSVAQNDELWQENPFSQVAASGQYPFWPRKQPGG
jgi:hypothetical protein